MSMMQQHNQTTSYPPSESRACGKTQRPVQNSISFVSFDSKATDETRKAVRKQAALASAATRKATIAAKLAKQKVDERKQGFTPAGSKSKDTKRKRTTSDDDVRDGQDGGSLQRVWSVVDQPHSSIQESQVVSRQPHRVVTAYLTPPHSVRSDSDNPHTIKTAAGVCRCLECRTTDVVRHGTPSTSPVSDFREKVRPSGTVWTLHSDNCGRVTGPRPITPEFMPGDAHSLADSMADPFNNYPTEYFPIYDKLLHHMLLHFAPRGWPALKITRAEGLEWEHWMTQKALAEPALFLVRLLFASGDLIRVGQVDPRVADWLRSLAIKAINDAISDPKRSTGDGLILAVGRIALSESMYGDQDAATDIHRPAQKRMIDLRGGMRALQFPPLVTRLMRWADNMMSIQSGTPRILGVSDDEVTTPDFGTKQGVDVLERWVPSQGRALRSKIAISDLVT